GKLQRSQRGQIIRSVARGKVAAGILNTARRGRVTRPRDDQIDLRRSVKSFRSTGGAGIELNCVGRRPRQSVVQSKVALAEIVTGYRDLIRRSGNCAEL